MNSGTEKKIQTLLDLMDDENEQTASLAMAELLRFGHPELLLPLVIPNLEIVTFPLV